MNKASAWEPRMRVALAAHPRLYFTPGELLRLRALRSQGIHARIWKNLAASADRCLDEEPRSEWIAPVSPDPIYENLYDRFYAMMHDMALTEHLAFAWAYSGEERYLRGAIAWLLACCRVWAPEAECSPDASKAYAVLRLLKGLAVGYDLLYEGLSDRERTEVRDAILSIAQSYFRWYLDNPGMAGPEQDKHHGSVEASSFGVAALALLSEVPEADEWLDAMVDKHTSYLLPHALTPSGTQEQSSNFWASTMQYRFFFLDALRRVTGWDLFNEYRDVMGGHIALAAIAGPNSEGPDEVNQSVLFGPCYGQLDYWSPVLLYLAREYRRPIYQHLALWDGSLGAIQQTGYVTPRGERLLFAMGGYAYAWYDSSVPDEVEPELPLSFEFAEVGEAYARASYLAGDLVVGVRQGQVVVHAGGRPVLVDTPDTDATPPPVGNLKLTDDGARVVIRCAGAQDSGFTEQTVELKRPDLCVITRKTAADAHWWCHGTPTQEGDALLWPDGVRVRMRRGSIVSLSPGGHTVEKIVGLGKLKLVDSPPAAYPLVTARPDDGELAIEVSVR